MKKLPLAEVPIQLMEAVARAFQVGERKYARLNWRAGKSQAQYANALMRHFQAWYWEGDLDESGLDHFDHLCACVAILAYIREVAGTDDRPAVLPVVAEDAKPVDGGLPDSWRGYDIAGKQPSEKSYRALIPGASHYCRPSCPCGAGMAVETAPQPAVKRGKPGCIMCEGRGWHLCAGDFIVCSCLEVDSGAE